MLVHKSQFFRRSRWGAASPRSSMQHQPAPIEAFLHHSDTAHADAIRRFAQQSQTARDIQDFHINGRGWSDIGYHFLVFQPFGVLNQARVFEGRNTIFTPAAQLNHNLGTLAICVVGEDEHLQPNTRFVIEQLIKSYPSVKRFGGHRDVTPTACPGDVMYAQIPQMARAAGVATYA